MKVDAVGGTGHSTKAATTPVPRICPLTRPVTDGEFLFFAVSMDVPDHAGPGSPSKKSKLLGRKALVELGYSVTDIELKSVTTESLAKELSSHDIIFVAGGNTTYLLQQSYVSGFAELIRGLLKQGKLYIGSSAGSILAGPTVEPMELELSKVRVLFYTGHGISFL